MNCFKIKNVTYLFIIISIALCSCGANHHLINNIIYKDADFNYEHLKNNGLIIGGFSSKLIDLKDEERMKYNSILSNTLLDELKDAQNIYIINTHQLIAEIGNGNYLEMMYNFDMEKTIDEEIVHLIKDAISNAKYILFAYIRNENIFDNSCEEYIENSKGKKEIETEYQKTYLLNIEFVMYEIFQEKLVFSNVIHNVAKRTETRTTRTGLFELFIDNLIQNVFYGKPAEINREEVLMKISKQFAKDLNKM